MKTFVVFAHPERNSFNGAMFDVAREVFTGKGHEFVSSDLYRMAFDPVSDRRNFNSVKDAGFFKQQVEEVYASEHNTFNPVIAGEMEKLFSSDLIIFQFPLWWFSMPAIMKGWVDRVFAMGKVYGQGRFYENGVLRGKKAMIALTTGGGEDMYGPQGHGEISQILYPINHGIFAFVGCEVLPPFVAWSAGRVTDGERAQYLDQYRELLQNIDQVEPIKYPPMVMPGPSQPGAGQANKQGQLVKQS